MAKSKKRKKNKKVVPQVKLKPENYIRKHARKLPIHECLIGEDWEETKFAPIIVSRKRANGNIVAATYIVDMQCLGVKDTFFIYDIDPYSYKENIENMEQSMMLNFIKIEPSLAFNIIYGAVEFAEDCGFESHKDFTKVTEYLLDNVETIEYVDVQFGDDEGKPYFFAGPYDDSDYILATLTKNVGEGNFNFTADVSTFQNDFDISKEPVSNKIIDQFLPDEKVKFKMDNFKMEEYRSAFMPQVMTAGVILEEIDGKIDQLQETFTNDPKLFDNVFVKVINQVALSQNKEVEELEEQVIDQVEYLVLFMFEKLAILKTTDFLFEPAYTPIPVHASPEEIEKMTQEQMMDYQKYLDFFMLEEERYNNAIKQYAYYFIVTNYKDANFEEETIVNEVIEKFLTDAKKSRDKEMSDQEIDIYQSVCRDTIELYKMRKKEN